MKNKLHPIHQKPDQKLLYAVEQMALLLEENNKYLQDLIKSTKKKDDLSGFIATVKSIKSTNEKLDKLVSSVDNKKIEKKLEEIKSASLIANMLLKKISEKEDKETDLSEVVDLLKELIKAQNQQCIIELNLI